MKANKKILIIFSVLALFIAGFFLFTLDLKLNSKIFLSEIRTGAILSFTNQERNLNNLNSLEESETLNKAAQLKAEHMASNQYFAHYSPEGISPWFWFGQADYEYERAGENLAVLFTHSQDVVRAWMNSPTHRANILKSGYTEIGIGTAKGIYKGRETTYIVQLFAKPTQKQKSIFTIETFGTEKINDTDVLGIETRNIYFSNLFYKENLHLTISFLALLLVSVYGAYRWGQTPSRKNFAR
jgi:hypothetical protein